MSKVILFGTGQIAEVAYYYLANDSEHEIAAVTVDKKYITKKYFKDLPIIAFEEINKYYPPDEYKMFIPISYKNVNKLRADKYYEAKEKGYLFISYISSKATYYNTEIGDNCFILEDNTIQPYSRIGDNVILWSGNHIGHHSIIENHCFIASQVVISGASVVGEYSFIGVNATLRDSIKIGKENIIGAGATILSDTTDKSVYVCKDTIKIEKTSDMIRSI